MDYNAVLSSAEEARRAHHSLFTKYLIIASLKKRQYFPKYTYV